VPTYEEEEKSRDVGQPEQHKKKKKKKKKKKRMTTVERMRVAMR
jgi:hypothetical protein